MSRQKDTGKFGTRKELENYVRYCVTVKGMSYNRTSMHAKTSPSTVRRIMGGKG